MAHLFDPFTVRDVEFADRVFVSPCVDTLVLMRCLTTGISCISAAARNWS
jgi:hypothetical protein